MRGYDCAQGVPSRRGLTIGRLEIQRWFARAAKTLPADCAGGFGKLKPSVTFAQESGLSAIEPPRQLSLLFLLSIVFPLFRQMFRLMFRLKGSWVSRSGFPVSAALAGLAGSRISAPQRASALRYVVVCGFLDLTVSSSFDCFLLLQVR
jgi:hypothetical protein